MPSPPEKYYLINPTSHVPNSPLPVLVYRGALPPEPSAVSVREIIEPNNWLQGGVFKHYPAHHFHSVTHECYAVFKGSSRLLLGRGPLDEPGHEVGPNAGYEKGTGRSKIEIGDVEVLVQARDVIVLPAGVAHCCLESFDEYEYVGLYPKGSPHWDNNFCKAGVEETKQKAENARAVPVPEYDPIFGKGGALVAIWTEAAHLAET